MRVLVRSRIRKNRVNRGAVTRFAEFVMRRAGFPDGSELSVLFVGAGSMRVLNERYRGEDRDTDVLAFPLERVRGGMDGGPVLGDVVISVDAARRQARRWRTTLNREVLLYLVHGILHLGGSDDETAGERKEMEARQEEILRAALKKERWSVIR